MTILFVCSGNTCRSPLAVAAWRALDADESQEDERQNAVGKRDRQFAECLGWRAGMRVGSAGLAAQAGAPASARAREAAHDWKADLAPHRARRLDEKLVREADLICTMTQQQAATVRARFGIAAGKVRVLGEYEARCIRPTRDSVLRDNVAPDDVYKPSSGDSLQQTLATHAMSSEHDENERLLQLLGETQWINDSGGCDIADPFGGSLEAYRSCAAQIRRAVSGLRAALREELPPCR